MEIYHIYTKLRKEFGRMAQFSDQPVEVLADVRPDDQLTGDYLDRNPIIRNIQIIPDMSEHEANTERFTYHSQGMSHTEGGWPKEVDPTEAEQTSRYRKKVEKDEDYIKAIAQLGPQIEELIRQNNAIDIYEEYFSGSVADHSSEQPYTKTLTSFKDPHAMYHRSANYISWYPEGTGTRKVAVAYAVMEFQAFPEGMPTSSYIWDVNNPNTPDFELLPASQMCCLLYNPKDPNILGAGLYNGQVAYYDTRKDGRAVDSSPIEHSHRDPVYDMAWLQSKTGTECMTCSTDGNVFWWDTRRLSEPMEELVLQEKTKQQVLGAVSMEYDPVAGPTKFIVGTEQGIIINCNRKAKTPAERIGASYLGHHGSVYSLKRNPFFPKYFLSIGDWTGRIWMEDLRTPIMTTKFHSSYLTGGQWSPTRPGVFFTIKMDGTMDVWDFFYKQNDPTLTVQVSDVALTAFNIQEGGKLVTTGAADGVTTLMDVSEGLAVLQPNEKQSISQMFERETKREKNLETRAKELAIKKRKEAAGKEAPPEENFEVLRGIEKEFFDATRGGEDYDDRSPLEYDEPASEERGDDH